MGANKELERSTITLPTAATIIIAVVGLFVQFLATRYAVQLEIERVHNKVDIETVNRISADEKLEMKIANNAKAIERVESAIKPSTVTTFR